MDQPQRRIRVSDSDRDRILAALTNAHVEGYLDPDEVDERHNSALKAKYRDELAALVDDLPIQLNDASARGVVIPATGASVPTRLDEPSRFEVAVVSGKDIRLEPGSPGINMFAFWGGHDIYVHDAMGPGNVVTLNVSAIMAGHSIYVPPGVRVIDECVAFMAGNDIAPDAYGDGSNGTLVLKGFLFLAGSDVYLQP